MDGPIIELAGVGKRLGDFEALKGVDLEVALGERVVVCGPSGSGKSTMIRCINRLERHDAGRIVVDGVELGPMAAAPPLGSLWQARFAKAVEHDLERLGVLPTVPARQGGRSRCGSGGRG